MRTDPAGNQKLFPDYLKLIELSRDPRLTAHQAWAAMIPGVLQTYGYFRAICGTELQFPPIDDEVEVAWKLRKERRRDLLDDGRVTATFILGEVVLHQLVGGTAVLAEQLRYLLKLADQYPRLRILLMPFAAGAYYGIASSPYVLLHGTDGFAPTLVVEDDTQCRLVQAGADHDAEIGIRRTMFTEMQRRALSLDESRAMIADRIRLLEAAA